ncbi:hypothetical protein KBC03_02155 [Patescibacteria group bacterium]|nr:hypothetical protein [Patescibacteria group bacterium]
MTSHDTNLVWQLNGQVDKAIADTNRSPEFLEKAATRFSTLVDSLQSDPRKQAIMKNVFEHAHNQLALLTDTATRSFKQQFVSTYINDLQGDSFELRLQRCVQKFDMVNTIAKKHNVPTALILATWFMESSCRMANPDNGDGLFQIVSSHYEPGPINDAQLEQEIIDFIMFSRKKWDRYHKSNPDRRITLTYKKWDLESLESQGALYNSVGSTINAWPLRATNEYYNR